MEQPIKVTISRDCQLIAHRGLALINPENTLEAFRYAGELGYYGMECDVHVTKDNAFVVFHDETLKRMTGVKGFIKDFTVDELKQLNIISGSNVEKYKEVKIPLLTEYLDGCVEYHSIPVIEIKEVQSNDHLDHLVKIIKDYKLEDKAIVISFNLEYLIYLKKQYSFLNIQYLVEDITDEVIQTCLNYAFDIDVCGRHLTEAKIEACLKAGLIVNVWTIDDPFIAEKLSEYGVHYITTNCLIKK